MTAARLLLLAPEPSARVLGEGLRAHGFRVETTQEADAALALAGGVGFDAAILDRNVVSGRALAVLVKRLEVPVCLLGLDTRGRAPPGVAAALAKPVRLDDLAGLMHGLARPAGATEKFGRFALDRAMRRLIERKTKTEIRLTELETGLLDILLKAGGNPVPRADLLRAVWGYKPGLTTRTLETHVYRLRQKIERDPARARLLITTPGGYLVPTTQKGARAK
jgi:DNA-binding response OmpR family regulator